MDFFLMNIKDLREHEEIEPIYLEKLKSQIMKDGHLKIPIIVDKNTNIILDGHYRLNSLKKLGFSKIAVYFVDYNSPSIFVHVWRNGEIITKEDVLRAGLTGNKFPPKTSKHMFKIANNFIHVSEFAKKINISLEELK